MKNPALTASIRFKRIRAKRQPATTPAPLGRCANCDVPGRERGDPFARVIERVLDIVFDYLEARQIGRRGPPAAEQSNPNVANPRTGKGRVHVDTVARFIGECCDSSDPRGRASSEDIYKLFAAWARSVGRPLISQRELSHRLRGLGFARVKSGTMHYRGITLACSPEDLRGAR